MSREEVMELRYFGTAGNLSKVSDNDGNDNLHDKEKEDK